MPRWFTCAPARFEASEAFFWRDSGLLCRALRKMGHESKVVLPGPAFASDSGEVVRGSWQELESPAWWRRLELDGVIMVGWGLHRHTGIVRAIAQSGARVVLHIDGDNIHFPFFNQREVLHTFWRQERDQPYGLPGKAASFAWRVTKFGLFMALAHSYLKVRHLRWLSLLSCQTPTSVTGHERLCRLFGGRSHGVNIRLMGYPIARTCTWDGSVKKEKRVVAIGRWDDLRTKRPHTLMAVCAALARKHPDLRIDLFGRPIPAFEPWLAGLEPDVRERIAVHGIQPGETVAAALLRAQISFFPSASEGGPQAMFEGLACGASTVSFRSPNLPGALWAAEKGHAELADRDTTQSYVAALSRALAKWERGEYDPAQISAYWEPWTSCELILQRMIAACETRQNPFGEPLAPLAIGRQKR